MVIRKRFGQHFLHDPAVIRRIIDAVAPTSGERVVELGPGRGALTFGLLERAQRLAERDATDPELRRQHPFGREPLPGQDDAELDRVGKALDRLFERVAGSDRPEDQLV